MALSHQLLPAHLGPLPRHGTLLSSPRRCPLLLLAPLWLHQYRLLAPLANQPLLLHPLRLQVKVSRALQVKLSRARQVPRRVLCRNMASVVAVAGLDRRAARPVLAKLRTSGTPSAARNAGRRVFHRISSAQRDLYASFRGEWGEKRRMGGMHRENLAAVDFRDLGRPLLGNAGWTNLALPSSSSTRYRI